MMNIVRRLAALTATAAVLASLPAAAGQIPTKPEDRTRELHVSVVDAKGNHVPDLTAADFTVREDGNPREILKVGPSTAPLTISLLVDDSQAAQPVIQFYRDGLPMFIEGLPDTAEVALATFGERPTGVVEYTSGAEQLKRGITRIFARPGSGAYFLDAVIESSRGLQRRNAARPVIVALVVEAGVEFSNRQHTAVLEELEKSGAVLHVLAIGAPATSLEDEIRERNLVIAEGTKVTGGRRDNLLAVMALPEKLKELAMELSTWRQYMVTYGRPERLVPPKMVEVSVNRPGVFVRPPRRAAGGR